MFELYWKLLAEPDHIYPPINFQLQFTFLYASKSISLLNYLFLFFSLQININNGIAIVRFIIMQASSVV